MDIIILLILYFLLKKLGTRREQITFDKEKKIANISLPGISMAGYAD
jgi:hypothetical protein